MNQEILIVDPEAPGAKCGRAVLLPGTALGSTRVVSFFAPTIISARHKLIRHTHPTHTSLAGTASKLSGRRADLPDPTAPWRLQVQRGPGLVLPRLALVAPFELDSPLLLIPQPQRPSAPT